MRGSIPRCLKSSSLFLVQQDQKKQIKKKKDGTAGGSRFGLGALSWLLGRLHSLEGTLTLTPLNNPL